MNKHYPSIKQAIYLSLTFYAIEIVIVIIFCLIEFATGFIDLRHPSNLFHEYPLLLGVINLFSTSLVVAWGYKKAKVPFQKVFPFRCFPAIVMLPITLTSIGLSILLSDFNNFLRLLLNQPVDPNDFLQVLANSNNVGVSFLVLSIIAPLTEEFFCRGLLLTGFINNYTVKKAVFLSALFFGILHLNIFQFPTAFIGGIFFAWLVIKTNSLLPSLYAHAFFNSIPIIASQVCKIQIPGYTLQGVSQIMTQPLWFDGIGVICLSVGIWLLWITLRRTPVIQEETLCSPIQSENGLNSNCSEESAALSSSKHGLTSMIIGFVTLISLLTVIVLFYFAIETDSSVKNYLLFMSLFTVLGLLSSLIGLGFGLVGIFKRSKFRWVGSIINGLYLLFVISIIIWTKLRN